VDDPDLSAQVARLRALLSGGDLLTYQQAARALNLHPPGMIQRLAMVLEAMMRADAATGRPFAAAKVVSRADGKPRRGFYDLAVELGRFPADPALHEDAWRAELARLGHDQAG